MPGTICTFYSYKGGVGRSFALANVAVLLRRWGLRVLCIDWDFEAPGLIHYFSEAIIGPPESGLHEMVQDFAHGGGRLQWEQHLTPAVCGPFGTVDLLLASRTANVPAEPVAWSALYAHQDFGTALESFRTEIKAAYDVVLVDSRTGITDIGGICTLQLPDVLVPVFGPNEQSIAGTLDVARRVTVARQALPLDRGGLPIVPVLARFDGRDEREKAIRWKGEAAVRLAELYNPWAPRSVSVADLLDRLTVPYISFWSFGEELPALTEPLGDPDRISHSLANLAAVLARNLADLEGLVRNRDEYIRLVRHDATTEPRPYDVFLSFSEEERDQAAELRAELTNFGCTVAPPPPVGESWRDALDQGLDRAEHLLLLLGAGLTPEQERALNRFSSFLFESKGARTILPVAIGQAATDDPIIAPFQVVVVTSALEAAVTVASRLGMTLAPRRTQRWPDPGGDGSDLPRRVTVDEMLGVHDPDDIAELVLDRWSRRSGLRAEVGVYASGILAIDLEEQGPHVLVGGTTGSGKSELLQTLLLSLAIGSSPADVNFVLINHKGGATFHSVEQLPHTVAVLTQLDGGEGDRILSSLSAEVRRRQQILRRHQARTLTHLRRTAPSEAPASLVIAIDEFASIVRETPEFIDGLVELGMVGRALGIHLVLATQRPAGVISSAIRTNVTLRIALRLTQEDESIDLIGSPDAAAIALSVPGRAIARIGIEPPIVFQTAILSDLQEATVSDLGRRSRVVAAIEAAADVTGTDGRGSPILPPLPEVVDLGSLRPAGPDAVPIGVVDDPKNQRQTLLEIDLAHPRVMAVVGGRGAGKTTFLKTVALALASWSDMDIYAVGSADGLDVLHQVPSVGSVLSGSDLEGLAALIEDLETRTGLGQNSRGPNGRIQVAVLIDDFDDVMEALEPLDRGEWSERLRAVINVGPASGLHVVTALSDTRRAMRRTTAFDRLLVLRQRLEDDYALIPDSGPPALYRVPGRCTIDGLVAQLAVPGGARSPDAIDGIVAAIGHEMKANRPSDLAPAVPRLPKAIRLDALPPTRSLAEVVVGVDAQLQPVHVDGRPGMVIVTGERSSGRSTALRTIAASLRAASPEVSCHLIRADPAKQQPAEALWSSLLTASDGMDLDLDALLDAGRWRQPIVFFDDVDRALRYPHVTAWVDRLVEAAEGGTLTVVIGGDLTQIGIASSLRRAVRDHRDALLLGQADQYLASDLFRVRLRSSSFPAPPGRGYRLHRGDALRMQVALPVSPSDIDGAR